MANGYIFIAIILCAIGCIIFLYRYFFAEQKIGIVMDASDSKAFFEFINIVNKTPVLGANYDDTSDVIRIGIIIRKRNYKKFLKAIKKISNVEVI